MYAPTMTGLLWKNCNYLIMKHMKMNRYVMSWSQADSMWMVVYAATLEDAEEMFEDGIYELEDQE